MKQEELFNLQDKMEKATEEERMAELQKNFPNLKLRSAKIGTTCEKNTFRGTHGDRNKYRITIQNGSQSFSTTFTDSIYNTQKGLKSSNFSMFYCVVADAQCYENDSTLEAFGYDLYEDRRKAQKCFNGCKKAYDNLINLFGLEGYEILNAVTYGF